MAKKSLFFVGNGIGRALDNDYFTLSTAIENVWNLPWGKGGLSVRDKKLISGLCGSAGIRPPQAESDLHLLHQVNRSCKILKAVEDEATRLLDDRGRQFPNAINYFIGRVGKYFVDYPGHLPTEFVDSLSDELRRTSGHLVTTNYDLLLYRALVERHVLDGYRGNLVDGVWGKGFRPENLERQYGSNFGWYLHLHGSPIYYNEPQGAILKYGIGDLDASFSSRTRITERHMVLTHSQFKADAIIDSRLLTVYWEYFLRSLYETETVYLLGYAGQDDHINRAISNWFLSEDSHRLIVIEYGEPEGIATRVAYWKRCIGGDEKGPSVEVLKDVTAFRW